MGNYQRLLNEDGDDISDEIKTRDELIKKLIEANAKNLDNIETIEILRDHIVKLQNAVDALVPWAKAGASIIGYEKQYRMDQAIELGGVLVTLTISDALALSTELDNYVLAQRQKPKS